MLHKKRPQWKQLIDADGFSKPKTEIHVGGLWNSAINPCMYHCCKRCAKKRPRRDFLPPEIVYKVLLHLPALVLRDVMKHVCREWSLIIRSRNFIRDHLLNSPRGLLIQGYHLYRGAMFVEMRGGCLEISKFDRVFDCLLWTSCNGLVLTSYLRDARHFYIANPMTKQQLLLPRFFCGIIHPGRCGLAFVEASMKYKVVQVYDYDRGFKYVKCAVLTIGVDKVWRHIDIEHLSLTTRKAFMSFPLVCGGFIYWVGETVILMMNVETEIVSQFPIPPLGKYQKFLPMGSNLSIIVTANDILWDVWEMNPEIGEWGKVLSFDLEPQSTILKNLFCTKMGLITPIGWLIDREVLVFCGEQPQRYCVAYNVKTGEARPIKLDTNANSHTFRAHVNSLGWLE